MLKYLISFLLIVSVCNAGFPPTTSKGQSATSKSTTFDFQAPYSQFTKTSSTAGLVETGSFNVLLNPGFEATTYSSNWTASGGTLAAAATTNIFFSKGATWDSSAASQTFTSTQVTVPEGFKGQNCNASLFLKVPSGTATHLLQAFDGTNILGSVAVVSSIYFQQNTVTFPCPTSGTFAVRLISVASDEPLVAMDEGYLGLARNVGSTQLISEWVSYTATLGGSVTGSQVAKWRRVGDSIQIRFYLAITNTPAGNVTISLPSGLTFDSSNIPGFGDNTSANGVGGWYDASGGPSTTTIRVYAASTNLLYLTNNNQQLGTGFATGDYIQFETFPLKITGWTSQSVVMPDAQGWFAAGGIGGGDPSLSLTTQASATEITNGSLVLVPATGSASVGIACASGTTSVVGATTCGVNESVGIITNVPTSGAYEVCFRATNYFEDSGAASNMNASQTFQVNKTSASSSTVVTSGGDNQVVNYKTNSSGGGEVIGSGFPFQTCPVFQLSAGANTFRLMYGSSISGTVGTNVLAASGGILSNNIYFKIRQFNAPVQSILANSVSTANVNGERIERLRYNCTSSSSIITSSLSGVTIGNISSGACSITFPAGTFSGVPSCVAAWESAPGTPLFVYIQTSSSTLVGAGCANSAGAACSGVTGTMICQGPR